MAKAVQGKLNSDWRPKIKSTLPELVVEQLTIGQCFDKALELHKDKVKSRTFANYRCLVRFLNTEVKDKKWQNEPLKNLKPHYVEDLLLSIKKRRIWTNKEYNRRCITLQSLFSSLFAKHLIYDNIVAKVPTLKSEKIIPYVPLTPEEQTRVINYFEDFLPNYNVFLKTLYHTGLRPAEVRFLKCSMVRLNGGDDDLLILPEELIKTDRRRIIPIPEDLRKDLLKHHSPGTSKH
ncbi:site-specific integrase [Chryseobacterium sp.]|uniref:site-specific integrase n=1 Tax=Chryseobacterium sp. TaxID=1871047 RepID=UPI00289F7D2B|nr:site-specific integrase [Chryseobacterium sp.]